MRNAIRFSLVLGVILPLAMFSSGCAYMQNRGSDAKDAFDIGLTFTKTPHVGVYAGFNSLLGVGYVNMDGHLLGIGSSQAGWWLPMRLNVGGMVLDGYEQYAYCGNYDALDKTTPKQRGNALGMLHFAKPAGAMEMLQCPKIVHVGWIGINVTCKLGELADFLVGWTTLDLAGDDNPAAAPVAPPPPPEKK